jgi:hypothetical protein
MARVWAILVSGILAGTSFGQAIEPEHGALLPPPAMPGPECEPCAPCWRLSLSIPKRPIRSWLGAHEGIQKWCAYWSYYSTASCDCGPTPEPCCLPPLYTFFLPPHCIDMKHDCGDCPDHGIWHHPTAVEGSASAGVPVGTVQHVQAVPATQEQPWWKSMWARKRNEREVAANTGIVPVSAQFAVTPAKRRR